MFLPTSVCALEKQLSTEKQKITLVLFGSTKVDSVWDVFVFVFMVLNVREWGQCRPQFCLS